MGGGEGHGEREGGKQEREKGVIIIVTVSGGELTIWLASVEDEHY